MNFGRQILKIRPTTLSVFTRSYLPCRALLYVPGNDEKKMTKAINLKSDFIAFDCEDGVAINKKKDARETIRNFFEKNHNHPKFSNWGVRLNAIETEYFNDDINCIFSLPKPPETILLPKIHSVHDLIEFKNKLENNIKKSQTKKINLIFYAESATGLLNLREICETAQKLSNESKIFKPIGIVFGSDDLCASVGITRTENSIEILYARQHCVLVAKAFNLQAIDMVYIDYKNSEGLKQQCLEGARFGFTGKQIIHPNQIQITQEAFTPSPLKIKWAQELIKAFDDHQKLGKGAFTFNNQMIDMPTVKQAKNIIELCKNVE